MLPTETPTAPPLLRVFSIYREQSLRSLEHYLEGVAAILETQADMILVGESCDGAEAVSRFRELQPDLTLMDLQMPRLGGVEAIKAIRTEYPNARAQGVCDARCEPCGDSLFRQPCSA